LREESPYSLFALASSLIEATTSRPLDDWPGNKVERSDGPSMFMSFADSEWPGMGALALALAALHPDELLAARLRNAVDPSVLANGPRWLSSLGNIEITGTWLQTEVLGDGEDVFIPWRWPDGAGATAAIYIDHNLGTMVKDAFVIPEPWEVVAKRFVEIAPPHLTTREIDPADARTRVADAIKVAEHTLGPFESDSWPACRPLVEWLLRHLPTGGTGHIRPEWSDRERESLLAEFMASPDAMVKGLSASQLRNLAEHVVSFGCDYGSGDPLRWSPVSVEIVMVDWFPRKVFGLTANEVRRFPELLRGFVRFAHQRREIPAELTEETVASIDLWVDAFNAGMNRPGRSPFDNARRIARLAAGFDPDEFDDDDDDYFDYDEMSDIDADHELIESVMKQAEEQMIELVGGRSAYDNVNDEPLGNVPFDWSRIPAEMRDLTAGTLGLLDQWASELFDDEVRTIARAVLAGILAADHRMFRRSARTDVLAAGILWFLMKRITGPYALTPRYQMPWKVLTQKELALATGVSLSGIGLRAQKIEIVADEVGIDWPANLHSTRRQQVLHFKQHFDQWRELH